MIPAERAHLRAAARTHPGMSGKNNEDRYAITAFQLGVNNPTPALLAVVSDGIGGHRAGEVAAEIAVNAISQTIAASDGRHPAEALQQAVTQASQKILQQADQSNDQRGMGATCACAFIIGDRLYTTWVGDSRIYLIRGGSIQQLSTDHTWIQEALENGVLTPDQAQGHPNAHVIRRYLGSRQAVVPDMRLRLQPGENDAEAEANQGVRLSPGDQLVLCSDGLTDLVSEEEIQAAVTDNPQEQALDRLVDLANERGGHDNITIVSLQMPEPALTAIPAGVPAGTRRRVWNWGCLGLAALLLIGAITAGGLYFYLNLPPVNPTPTSGVPLLLPTTVQTSPLSPSGVPATPAGATPSPANTTPKVPTATRSTPGTVQAPTLTPWPTNTPALQ